MCDTVAGIYYSVWMCYFRGFLLLRLVCDIITIPLAHAAEFFFRGDRGGRGGGSGLSKPPCASQ